MPTPHLAARLPTLSPTGDDPHTAAHDIACGGGPHTLGHGMWCGALVRHTTRDNTAVTLVHTCGNARTTNRPHTHTHDGHSHTAAAR